ncbi:HU family DNA-binding protein [uncultured Mediterranea sp.]|uniref:HU family DNA-binding protein n=1 Tax=uncultured Mediterranea sp. TaxID=1926662 RepID=UPI0027D97D77|nr:HU family DNA-binding protein [uncultured Mediterranea sp.]
MNKAELISAMAAGTGMKRAEAAKALEALVDAIADALKRGEKVSMVGFGTFSVAERAARMGINPVTKEAIEIPAKKIVRFKPGSELTFE